MISLETRPLPLTTFLVHNQTCTLMFQNCTANSFVSSLYQATNAVANISVPAVTVHNLVTKRLQCTDDLQYLLHNSVYTLLVQLRAIAIVTSSKSSF